MKINPHPQAVSFFKDRKKCRPFTWLMWVVVGALQIIGKFLMDI